MEGRMEGGMEGGRRRPAQGWGSVLRCHPPGLRQAAAEPGSGGCSPPAAPRGHPASPAGFALSSISRRGVAEA